MAAEECRREESSSSTLRPILLTPAICPVENVRTRLAAAARAAAPADRSSVSSRSSSADTSDVEMPELMPMNSQASGNAGPAPVALYVSAPGGSSGGADSQTASTGGPAPAAFRVPGLGSCSGGADTHSDPALRFRGRGSVASLLILARKAKGLTASGLPAPGRATTPVGNKVIADSQARAAAKDELATCDLDRLLLPPPPPL